MKILQPISKFHLWTSYILQGLVSLMFLNGAIQNLLKTDMAVEGIKTFGFPESSLLYFGLILLIGTVLYLIPKTAVLGAILLTGWLGGAVATHIVHGDPVFNIFFPVFFGVIVWLSLWLRFEGLRQITPVAK